MGHEHGTPSVWISRSCTLRFIIIAAGRTEHFVSAELTQLLLPTYSAKREALCTLCEARVIPLKQIPSDCKPCYAPRSTLWGDEEEFMETSRNGSTNQLRNPLIVSSCTLVSVLVSFECLHTVIATRLSCLSRIFGR